MEKRKLSIDEQIEDMQEKGIAFDICSIDDAKKYLMHNTYYFKLKVYEKNYSNDNRERKYRNLDFEYLKELSKLDMHIREMVLDMCLDIEHVLKTRLVYDCTINPDTDGFDFVQRFLNEDYSRQKKILDRAKGNTVSSSLAANYVMDDGTLKPIPVWVIVELLSFGDFVNLYTNYHQTYKRYPDYSRYMGSIKYLRNASAHNNCLIGFLKKKHGFKKTFEVMQTLSRAKKISGQTRDHKMSVPVVHDFVTLLLVYNDLLSVKQNRNMRSRKMDVIKTFFLRPDGRGRKHANYFDTNATLREAFQFICDVLVFIENEGKNPRSRKLLKTN